MELTENGVDVTGLNYTGETPRERVERLQRDNDAAIQSLAKRGVGITGDVILNVRLQLLLEHLLGDLDEPRRLAYELACQQRFTELVAEIQGQVNRALLLQGVNGATVPIPGAGG